MPQPLRALSIVKATAAQRAEALDNGLRFVLSTDAVDLSGDIVEQQGLTLARDPLPAQINHSGNLFDLIGQWRDVRTTAHKTTAVLDLLARGTSHAADLVRDLYEQGIQLAASIGFVPLEYEPIDPAKPWGGMRWKKGQLTEASIVVTPANPQALEFCKSLEGRSAYGQLPGTSLRASIITRLQGAIALPTAGTSSQGTPMNIGEQIRAAETALNGLRDRLLAATNLLASAADEEQRTQLTGECESINRQVEASERTLAVLKTSERALAARAVDVTPAPSTIAAPAVLSTPRLTDKDRKTLIVRAGVCTLAAHLRRIPLAHAIEELYGNDPLAEATRHCTLLLQHQKAAQPPALTSVPEWAGALVRDGYGAFLEDLQRDSVVPRLPLVPENFDGFNSITVAYRKSDPTANPNLAAAFRGEGDPIRVGSVQVGSKKLTPKSMGIIGTWSQELYRRSTPNIEQKIHDWMIEDTAIALDTIFLGNGAGTAKQPAGIANGLAAGDTAPSTGNSAAQITADLRARLQAMAGHSMGRRPVWIMNPAHAWGLALSLTATGQLAFPSMGGTSPTLVNIPVVTSITVPVGTVYLIDAAEITFAGGAPEFLASDVATLHEEYDQSAVAPISSVGTPNAVAAPVRSLYQTFTGALRAIWEVDWLVLRAGAVQTITGVAW